MWTITQCCIIQMFVNLMSKASTKSYLSFYSGSWHRRRKTHNSPHSKLTCRLHGDLTSKPSRLINHGHAALAVARQPGCKNRGEAEQSDDTDSPAWPTLGSNLEAAQKYAAMKPSSRSGETLVRLSALKARERTLVHDPTARKFTVPQGARSFMLGTYVSQDISFCQLSINDDIANVHRTISSSGSHRF